MRVAFPERLKRIEEARAPFAQALREALNNATEPDLLIYTPKDDGARIKTPASVLAILSSGWLLIEENLTGVPSVVRVDFSQTIAVELTGILLYGRLEISYVHNSALQRAVVVFNTVMNELYSEATERILRGTRGLTGEAGLHTRETAPGMNELPFKFRSAVLDLKPAGEHVKALFCWPMITSQGRLWLCHELAPAGLLVLTEHTLLIIREELVPGLIWRKARPHYGKITSFVPLSRLCGHALHELDDLPLVQVTLRVAAEGAIDDALDIELPLNRAADAQAFLNKLVSAAHDAGGLPWQVNDTRNNSD